MVASVGNLGSVSFFLGPDYTRLDGLDFGFGFGMVRSLFEYQFVPKANLTGSNLAFSSQDFFLFLFATFALGLGSDTG